MWVEVGHNRWEPVKGRVPGPPSSRVHITPRAAPRSCRWRMVTMFFGLGCLVSARRLLHQSKPSIEALEATTGTGGCNPCLAVRRQDPGLGSRSGAARRHDARAPLRAPTPPYLSHRPQTPSTPHAVLRRRPETRAISRPDGLSARTTGGGVGQLRGISARRRQNACKHRGSGAGAAASKRGVDGT